MKRLLLISLIAVVLLTQWGVVAHAYQAHDDETVCELCLVGSQHDHALAPGLSSYTPISARGFDGPASQQPFTQQTPCYYSVRAPPRFL